MNIDQNAPLTARKELVIDAPIDKVWALQSDIGHWAEWQPDIQSVTLQGDLKPGTIFRWKAQGLNITSQLHTVEAPHRIGWTGTSIGMKAVHNWTFEAQAGKTRVQTEESLSGPVPRLIKLIQPRFLEKSLEASLQTLKAKAENN